MAMLVAPALSARESRGARHFASQLNERLPALMDASPKFEGTQESLLDFIRKQQSEEIRLNSAARTSTAGQSRPETFDPEAQAKIAAFWQSYHVERASRQRPPAWRVSRPHEEAHVARTRANRKAKLQRLIRVGELAAASREVTGAENSPRILSPRSDRSPACRRMALARRTEIAMVERGGRVFVDLNREVSESIEAMTMQRRELSEARRNLERVVAEPRKTPVWGMAPDFWPTTMSPPSASPPSLDVAAV